MRIIHIADCHLMAEPEKGTKLAKIRKQEILDSFAGIIDVCNETEADLLLIAGDLFHSAPRLKDLKEIDYLFKKLLKTRVVLVAGNHDYIGPRSFYRDYEWQGPVTMITDSEMTHVTFADIRTSVYGFSYPTRDVKEPVYDDVKAVGDGIQILLAHGGDEKNAPMNFRKIAQNGFEYVALGHIHKPDVVGTKIAYAGSLEPLDRNETGAHGYMLVDITGEEAPYTTVMEFVPFSKREYRDMEVCVTGEDTNGSVKDRLTKQIIAEGEQHMYRVTVTGKREADLTIDTDALMECGLVTEVIDKTLPEFDIEGLRKANADNLIGMFIEALSKGDNPSENAKNEMALYYGLEALLNREH